MSESTTLPRPIACRVGLTPAGCFIESPKTGKRIEFPRTERAIDRIVGRITQCIGTGTLRAEFTTDELRAAKLAADSARTITVMAHRPYGLHRAGVYVRVDERRTMMIDGKPFASLPADLLSRLNHVELTPCAITPAEFQILADAAKACSEEDIVVSALGVAGAERARRAPKRGNFRSMRFAGLARRGGW